MANDKMDILNKTLLGLESELESFGKTKDALSTAHNELSTAREELISRTKELQEKWIKEQAKWATTTKNQQTEWMKLIQEQQENAGKLVKTNEDSIVITKSVTVQAQRLAESLIPLAKAIEGVNFPLRLDKIDMAVSTQASTTASIQGAVERGFGNLHSSMESVNKNVVEASNTLNSKMDEARKLNITMIVLLVINLLVGLTAIFYKH